MNFVFEDDHYYRGRQDSSPIAKQVSGGKTFEDQAASLGSSPSHPKIKMEPIEYFDSTAFMIYGDAGLATNKDFLSKDQPLRAGSPLPHQRETEKEGNEDEESQGNLCSFLAEVTNVVSSSSATEYSHISSGTAASSSYGAPSSKDIFQTYQPPSEPSNINLNDGLKTGGILDENGNYTDGQSEPGSGIGNCPPLNPKLLTVLHSPRDKKKSTSGSNESIKMYPGTISQPKPMTKRKHAYGYRMVDLKSVKSRYKPVSDENETLDQIDVETGTSIHDKIHVETHEEIQEENVIEDDEHNRVSSSQPIPITMPLDELDYLDLDYAKAMIPTIPLPTTPEENLLKPDNGKPKWTRYQDELLAILKEKYHLQWRAISLIMGGKHSQQAAQMRYLRVLRDRNLPFTEAQDAKLRAVLVDDWNNRWCRISRAMGDAFSEERCVLRGFQILGMDEHADEVLHIDATPVNVELPFDSYGILPLYITLAPKTLPAGIWDYMKSHMPKDAEEILKIYIASSKSL